MCGCLIIHLNAYSLSNCCPIPCEGAFPVMCDRGMESYPHAYGDEDECDGDDPYRPSDYVLEETVFILGSVRFLIHSLHLRSDQGYPHPDTLWDGIPSLEVPGCGRMTSFPFRGVYLRCSRCRYDVGTSLAPHPLTMGRDAGRHRVLPVSLLHEEGIILPFVRSLVPPR